MEASWSDSLVLLRTVAALLARNPRPGRRRFHVLLMTRRLGLLGISDAGKGRLDRDEEPVLWRPIGPLVRGPCALSAADATDAAEISSGSLIAVRLPGSRSDA